MCKSFIEKQKGSNSKETGLSRVSARIEIRFLIIYGVTSMLRRCKGVEEVGIKEEPEWLTCRVDQLPIMMWEEEGYEEWEESIPMPDAMWEVALVSTNQVLLLPGLDCMDMEFRVAIRANWSYWGDKADWAPRFHLKPGDPHHKGCWRGSWGTGSTSWLTCRPDGWCWTHPTCRSPEFVCCRETTSRCWSSRSRRCRWAGGRCWTHKALLCSGLDPSTW